MKKPKQTTNYFEVMEELGKKHGIRVTEMSKRGIRAIGFLSGVGGKTKGGQIGRTLRSILAGLSYK